MKNSNEVVHGDRQFFVLYESALELLNETLSLMSLIYLCHRIICEVLKLWKEMVRA
jgi:hypothetical protein